MPTRSGRWWTKLLLWPGAGSRSPAGLAPLLRRLPAFHGRTIRIEFLPAVTSCNRRLESGTGRGVEVHAASFLRRRRIVLDAALLSRPRELERILVHELFHFVWLRAGNPARRSFERVIEAEIQRRARGELGWSAERRKVALDPGDSQRRTRPWREYACESFCDTAAWMFTRAGMHDEFTLAARYRNRRRCWMRGFLGGGDIPI